MADEDISALDVTQELSAAADVMNEVTELVKQHRELRNATWKRIRTRDNKELLSGGRLKTEAGWTRPRPEEIDAGPGRRDDAPRPRLSRASAAAAAAAAERRRSSVVAAAVNGGAEDNAVDLMAHATQVASEEVDEAGRRDAEDGDGAGGGAGAGAGAGAVADAT